MAGRVARWDGEALGEVGVDIDTAIGIGMDTDTPAAAIRVATPDVEMAALANR